jgi:predicted CXXCH cytochrome family protein
MRVSLVEIKQRAGGKRVRLEHSVEVESLHVGRGPDNDLSLKGLTISLHHATLRIGDGHVYIEAAVGSDIQINGLPTQGERLAVGDEIHIGPWALRLIQPAATDDLRIEYEERQTDDARTALDRRTQLGIESGPFARRPLSWIAIGVVLLGFLALPLVWPALRPIWTTGEVTRGHAIIENDCASCHGGLFQRVENDACTNCHVDVRRHAPTELAMAALDEMRCAQCHLEHRGREVSLADQGAAFCVTCHADLSEHLPESEFESASDFEANHPGIQLSMTVDSARPRVRVPWSPDLAEESGVEFDHNFHVSQALDGPEDEEWLDCGQCHRTAEDGVAMQPIDFDRHCRRCHELDPGEPALIGAVEHGDPDRIREQLRRFFTNQVLEARVDDRSAPRALRQRRAGRLIDEAERTLSVQWVGRRVSDADEALFGDEGCALCHDAIGGFVSEETGDWVSREVAPVNLGAGWIQNARFSHAAHATHPCATCHPAAAIRDPDADIEDEPDWAAAGSIPYGLIDDRPDVSASESSADVMIPGIQVCRECHVSSGGRGHRKVASPCSVCHDFHDHDLAPMAARHPAGDDGEG